MFSSWRKRGKKDEKTVFPTGVAPVDQAMQKKYAKGVQYNLKVIIKGDRNTGKSTLLHRLTGGEFREEYKPTHEIQVADVNWNYRGADDIVKVEVWDIVDKSQKKRTLSDSLKITNDEVLQPTQANMDGVALDAELINVYKGTHGVIFTMDITKAWTWQYVQREIQNVPRRIPILVLANFRDMGDHRVVPTDEILAHIEHLERPTGSAEVYFSEASMKDGFGLRFVYKFINMPFLLLQRETILRQLQANTLEIEDTRETLGTDIMSEEQNYSLFKDMMALKENPSLVENNTDDSSPVEQRKEDELKVEETPQQNSLVTKSSATQKQLPIATVPPNVRNKDLSKEVANTEIETQNSVSANVEQKQQTPEQPKQSRFQAYKAKLFGGDSAAKKETNETAIPIAPGDGSVVPVDEFVPGQLDDNFLGGTSSNKNTKQTTPAASKTEDSDSDEDTGNPMVAGYEDLESEDEPEFEQEEESAEDDFDDLSDDERKHLEENETSLIEQIKSTKKKKKEEYVVNTQTIDIDTTNEYDNLDEDAKTNVEEYNQNVTEDNRIDNSDIRQNVVSESTEITPETLPKQAHTRETIPKHSKASENTPKASETVQNHSESEDDVDGPSVYVIADDVDFDDSYVKNDSSDDNDDDESNQHTNKKDDKLDIKQEAPVVISEESTPEPAVNDTGNNSSATNFDLDALEMFMSDQLKKETPQVETHEDTPAEVPKPKKKKKKKVVNTQEETKEQPSSEKKKKKKKKVADGSEEKNSAATTTKKSKTLTDGTAAEKKKKKNVVKTSKSEYDAFFD